MIDGRLHSGRSTTEVRLGTLGYISAEAVKRSRLEGSSNREFLPKTSMGTLGAVRLGEPWSSEDGAVTRPVWGRRMGASARLPASPPADSPA